MFAYSGWNAASYVAEEIRTPERTLPRALLAGAAIVALFYVALNAAFIYALPLESLKGVVSVGAKAAEALFGTHYGGLFVGVMAAAILGCVSAMTLVGPRVYYAMARDGCFFRDAGKVHPRWHTPDGGHSVPSGRFQPDDRDGNFRGLDDLHWIRAGTIRGDGGGRDLPLAPPSLSGDRWRR